MHAPTKPKLNACTDKTLIKYIYEIKPKPNTCTIKILIKYILNIRRYYIYHQDPNRIYIYVYIKSISKTNFQNHL